MQASGVCPTGTCTPAEVENLMNSTVQWPDATTTSNTSPWDNSVGTGGFICTIANGAFLGGTDVSFTMTFTIPTCYGPSASTDYQFLINPSTPNPMPSPLPVELTSFDANVSGAVVVLNWETASEINNDYFQIERSVNGSAWENIGFVEGEGTTTSTTRYEFVDENPLTGISYYRLKQVDFDDKFEYSDKVSVERESDFGPYYRVFDSNWNQLFEGYGVPPSEGTHILYYKSANSKDVVKREMVIRA